MHPQQRVAMRVAWKALENAGVNPGALAGADGGVLRRHVADGVRPARVHRRRIHRPPDRDLGQLGAAGRISHCLGLIGPSMSVDAACASSLTALHLAASVGAIGRMRLGTGGRHVRDGFPGAFFEFARLNALSNDGHCRSYSDDASGTVWGEGAGMVLVEHESRARQTGTPDLRTHPGRPHQPQRQGQADPGSPPARAGTVHAQDDRRGGHRSRRCRNDRRTRHRDPRRATRWN